MLERVKFILNPANEEWHVIKFQKAEAPVLLVRKCYLKICNNMNSLLLLCVGQKGSFIVSDL